jgi:putative membrane protein
VTWHVHPDVIVGIGLLAGAYLLGLRAAGRREGLRATRGQIRWFMAGVAVLFAGAGTPIHDLAEQRLFSIHMVQHLLFSLVAPPLLLMGMPDWLLRPLLRPGMVLRVARVVTMPVFAFALFSVVTVVTHLPGPVDFTLRHHYAHFVAHVVLVGSALLMWWPVLSPLPELPRLSAPAQMAYLFVQSFVPTVLASFITFSSDVWYDFYAAAPRTWGISAHTDQLIAGLIMKLAGGVVLWIVIGVVFFAWVAREEKQAHGSPLRWEDVQEELDRMGLTKPGARK